MARILVADDDFICRNLVTDCFSSMGHEVIDVSDGREALREWQQAEPPFDCLIFDVYLPGISGFELMEKIREMIVILDDRKRRAPVIITTSDGRVETEVKARQKKAFSFLIKPYTKEKIKQAVDNALLVVSRQE
ncbi:MAG: response regulator [Deltaproteobacteria bacterium]|nr:response regulator [Deltaproteobacteria bacterium]